MTQNLVTLNLSDDQLAVVDQALFALESQLTTLIALNSDQRRSLRRMGVKSEAFCRKTLSVLEQNPQVVPSSLPLSEAQSDLSSLDKLRPRVQRLQRLSERAVDTEIALGSDVMVTALQGYALLKVSGKNQGLEGLRRSLGAQFKTTRTAEPVAA